MSTGYCSTYLRLLHPVDGLQGGGPGSAAVGCLGPALRVTVEENEGLGLAFLPQEIDQAALGMKSDTAPGPDGWPVAMFKRFWQVLKGPIFEVCNGFMRGTVDISRLNFGVLSLIPKVQGADNIRLFRPIALINVPFKICSKACSMSSSYY